MTIDGRKYVRFLARGDSFAALRKEFQNVGKINDISVKGLGFSFLREVSQVDHRGQHLQIDIFDKKKGFHLSKISCRIVYEILDASPDKGFHVQMSRCGLQFEDLSKNQLEQLELFLENYTSGVLDTQGM